MEYGNLLNVINYFKYGNRYYSFSRIRDNNIIDIALFS